MFIDTKDHIFVETIDYIILNSNNEVTIKMLYHILRSIKKEVG
jgi:hypothetical protein